MDYATAMARLVAGVMNAYSDNREVLPKMLDLATTAYVDGMKKIAAAGKDLPGDPTVAALASAEQRMKQLADVITLATTPSDGRA